MINMTKKYKYRKGGEARILCVDGAAHLYPVVSMAENGAVYKHRGDGTYCAVGEEHAFDLIEVKEERVMWLNIFPSYDGTLVADIFPTKERANTSECNSRVARVKVVYTEGQFDD